MDSVIFSGCTTRIKSGEQGLPEITSLLKDSAEELQNDTTSLNETCRKEKHYVSTISGNTVAGIISYGGKQDITMYCEACGCQRDFKNLKKNKRVNETLTVDRSLQNVRKVLSSVQLVRCCTCSAQYEINPAEYTQVDFTRNHDSKEERLEHVSDTSETVSELVQNTSETRSEHVLNASKTDKTAIKLASEIIPETDSDTVQISNSAKV